MASTPRSARPGGQPSEGTSRPDKKPSEGTSRPEKKPSEVTSRPEKKPSKPTGAAKKPAAAPRKRIPRVEETSAGGFVLDSAGLSPKAALIARRDRRGRLIWSLPKGHIEEGETPEEAAIREVFEETGIRGRIVASLGTIDFWFMAEDHRVHKTVHHYVLRATGGTLSDTDAEVTEVAWVPLDEVSARLRYADERRLVARVQAVVAERAGKHRATGPA